MCLKQRKFNCKSILRLFDIFFFSVFTLCDVLHLNFVFLFFFLSRGVFVGLVLTSGVRVCYTNFDISALMYIIT